MTEATEVQPRTYASAGGVVLDPHTECVLVLLRPKRLRPDGQPEVRLPKGHVEPGESRSETALREVREEAGISALEIVADLGNQSVEFDWRGYHYVRNESYFLLVVHPSDGVEGPEQQFERLWLPWEEACERLTFEAEREWVRRAQRVWARRRKRAARARTELSSGGEPGPDQTKKGRN